MAGKNIRIFAFGGNEVAPVGMVDEKGHDIIPDISMQWQRTHETCRHIADIICRFPDDEYIITHGNGPQVGNILLRAEYSRRILPPLPLDICGADSQGAMGYMIGQLLENQLKIAGSTKEVTALVTRVVVDVDDPGFKNPVKFIGPSYTREQAEERMEKDGWTMKVYKKNDKGDEIWRKVVPSPKPLDIVEFDMIESALEKGKIPVAVGGGGIPVVKVKKMDDSYLCNYGIRYKDGKGSRILSGVEAVVDKDLASALLGAMLIRRAREQGEEIDVTLTIFTGENGAKLNYQKPDERDLRKLTLQEARQYLEQGQFPAGSMGPKIEAIIYFLENGGKAAYITLTDRYPDTLAGRAGTTITV
ncbi:MAG: carbamate kinase [bacterium]|nr:carbamate kinase [bacterium]